MSIIKRIQSIISANINDLLDKVEDPEKTVRQIIRDMERGISEMRKNTASVIASKNMTERKLLRAGAEEKTCMENAKIAVVKNDDKLATRALEEKYAAAQRIEALRKQLEDEVSLVSKLKAELANLEDKIQEARTKRDTIIAKKRAAETKKRIMKSAEKYYSSAGNIINGFDAFEKFDRKIDEQASELEAADEMRDLMKKDDSEEMFSKMKKENDINRELTALKKKLGG